MLCNCPFGELTKHVSISKSQISQRQIKDPPLIADSRNSNPSIIPIHKTRSSRLKKREIANLRPSAAQFWSSASFPVPKSSNQSGYACHICIDTKVQDNSANVRQHFLSKHNSELKELPSIQIMIEAAQSYGVRKEEWKNQREKPKKNSKPLNKTTKTAACSKVRFKLGKSLTIQPTTHIGLYS